MTGGGSTAQLAAAYLEISRRLVSVEKVTDAFTALATLGAQVPGAQDSGVTQVRNGSFATPAATGPLSTKTDAIQYEVGAGPCLDAVLSQRVFRTGDVRVDPRWPEFGRRAHEETGLLSMLSVRLFLEDDDQHLVGLNMYSREPDAFDDDSETFGVLLATHGSLALSSARAREQAANLQTALENRTEIGIAMGILMVQHKVTREDAFNLLRVSSQLVGRKLRDVAADVADTGTLPLPSTKPPTAPSEPRLVHRTQDN
jgi:transcriptional regulator with GAF, ATPase, and Fis domain